MRVLKAIILGVWALPCSALICHPKINNHLPQYIVGYRSLIDEQSKKRTDPTAQDSFPAVIKGYERSWSAHGNLPGLNATFLSVSENPEASFNGVIYKLSDPKKMEQYDKRERVYCRRALSLEGLNVIAATLPTQKQVWIYISTKENHQYPTHDYPIVQSYVDTFLRGCVQIEERFKIKNFAEDCIKSTDQWPVYWINDRIFPRRPSLFEPYAAQVDSLLKTLLPKQFKKIRFENSVDTSH